MGANTSQDQDEEPKLIRMQMYCDITVRAAAKFKLPHNFEAIVKEADSPLDKSSSSNLYEQLNAGVFLNNKRKRYWVEEKTNRNCFMVFARDLSITWGEDNRYWQWSYLKDTSSEEFVDVAEMLDVCWLEVHGKFQTENLSPGVNYQVVFVVMLKDPVYGWNTPVNFRLTLPDGNTQHHKENLMEKPRGRWIEIPVGEYKTTMQELGREIKFSLIEIETLQWKKGLAIKGVVIRPKT